MIEFVEAMQCDRLSGQNLLEQRRVFGRRVEHQRRRGILRLVVHPEAEAEEVERFSLNDGKGERALRSHVECFDCRLRDFADEDGAAILNGVGPQPDAG